MKKFNVVVEKEFRDKYTGLKHKPGDKLEVSEDRLREIRRSGKYVKVLGVVPEKAASEPKK